MSWISSLMSALGSAAGTAIDESSLIANGFVDETLNANNRDAYARSPKITPFLVGGDPQGGAMGNMSEGVQRIASLLDTPARAIDRAAKTWTGDELFADRPYLNNPLEENRSMRGVAEQPRNSDDPLGELARLKASTEEEVPQLAERMHMLNMQRHNDKMSEMKRMADDEMSARLQALKDVSSPDSLSFVAKGDRIEGDMPMNTRGSFTKSQRPITEQSQIRTLGALGVPQNAAQAIVDNTNSEQARQAILQLTSKQMMSKQEMVQQALQSYQQNVSKADNKEAVQAALVMQLRNIGLSDPAIKMMLMSLM